MVRLLVLLFLTLFIGQSLKSLEYPVYDTSFDLKVPAVFRSPQFFEASAVSSLQGFGELKVSGSAQFSADTFDAMIEILPISPSELVVCDLREESHALINGFPVSWTDGLYNYFNRNKTKAEIEMDEWNRLNIVKEQRELCVGLAEPRAVIAVQTAEREQNMVEGRGATYFRLPVTDHNRPSDDIIDQFIQFVQDIGPQQWIHLHCKAGKGRTTTFLVMFDAIYNASRVSLQDILDRQCLIGGSDLGNIEKRTDEERIRAAKERFQFIEEFYRYCKEVSDFQVSWSEWSSKNCP